MLTLASILFGGLLPIAVAYSLGRICLRRLPAPHTIALAAGAAVESLLVFLLLLVGAANRITLGVLGAASLIPLVWLRPKPPADPATTPLDRASRYLLFAVFGCYGVLYVVNALAPEIQPDGVTYHLGLVREYLRLGGFPSRVGFYEMLPQGMEMLFVFAFAFGRHSAAKLVHFAFLLATPPLMLQIGRRLQLSDATSLTAAALYFCAPVAGVSGTCSYNDAALVFFTLATLYLLLVWKQERDDRYLVPAGLVAGFCYAIKFTGIVTPALAVLFVLTVRRRKAILILGAAAVVMIAPWMLRDAILSGNPVAPLFNRWFPNPYFHVPTEQQIARTLRSYGGVTVASAPYQLAIGGALQGIIGPLFLAMPLGLLALRRHAGRLCWLAAALLSIPWFWNMGTRFLMPALPFLAFAFAMVLPRRAAWACLAVEAVSCWPQVIDLYDQSQMWRLRELPWRAALRLELEADYLWRQSDEYKVAQMVERETQPGERIFALMATGKAYIDREVLEFWHSAQADQLRDALAVAGRYRRDPLWHVTGEWPAQPLRALRFRLARPIAGEWYIHEARLFSVEDRVYPSPEWSLRAWPNPWESPAAFDGNLATRWRTWEPGRTGMYLEADLGHPQLLGSAMLVLENPAAMEFFGLGTNGQWRLLSNRPQTESKPREDLRKPAVHAIRHDGFRYILVPADEEGNGPLGRDMAQHAEEWGLYVTGQAGSIYLLRIL